MFSDARTRRAVQRGVAARFAGTISGLKSALLRSRDASVKSMCFPTAAGAEKAKISSGVRL